MVRAIERTPPIHAPGTRTGYHGLTYGYLVGEILQRVTSRSFSRLVQQELAGPLELDGMYVGAPKRVLSRAAKLIWPGREAIGPRIPFGLDGGAPGRALVGAAVIAQGLLRLAGIELDLQSILDALAPRGISSFDFGAERTLRAAIPAANGLFTARALAKMYAALAGGGEIDGVRLLSQRTLLRATRVQDPTHGGRLVIPWDMRWRLGYHGVATTRGVPRRAFGHFGFGGSGGVGGPAPQPRGGADRQRRHGDPVRRLPHPAPQRGGARLRRPAARRGAAPGIRRHGARVSAPSPAELLPLGGTRRAPPP